MRAVCRERWGFHRGRWPMCTFCHANVDQGITHPPNRHIWIRNLDVCLLGEPVLGKYAERTGATYRGPGPEPDGVPPPPTPTQRRARQGPIETVEPYRPSTGSKLSAVLTPRPVHCWHSNLSRTRSAVP